MKRTSQHGFRDRTWPRAHCHRDGGPHSGRAHLWCERARCRRVGLEHPRHHRARLGQGHTQGAGPQDRSRSQDRQGAGDEQRADALPLCGRSLRQSNLHRGLRQGVAAAAVAQGGHSSQDTVGREGSFRGPCCRRPPAGLLPPSGPLHLRERQGEGPSQWARGRERLVCRAVQWQVISVGCGTNDVLADNRRG